ncbi:MAG: hypothetical protein B7Y45_06350 [Sphingomonas sp. 28-66-16]|nr:MAG: hypothetical protein B7Y45_06350 [Sphingomonas sp. 28-66-16]
MLLIALVITACGFLFMGVAALAMPKRVTGQFGISTLDADGRNEVRAVYGGFGIAISAALTTALWVPSWRGPSAVAVAIALGGMASGRIFSAMLDRHIGRLPLLYGTIEAVTSLVLWSSATG